MAEHIDISLPLDQWPDDAVIRQFSRGHGYRWYGKFLREYMAAGFARPVCQCGRDATWTHNGSDYCDIHWAAQLREWKTEGLI